MHGKSYKIRLLLLALVLVFGASRVQWILVRQRETLGLNRYTELKGAPPVLALTTMALGGFRGLISNALWIRASELQENEKFFEMAQLADWITKLEPHFTQVWLLQGWNMAFNISVKFNDKEDRWRWLERGIELLRDDGLRYNPYDILIHRELAWFFQFKMGGNMDDAHGHYKRMWALEMEKVFGGSKPNWDELMNPVTEDAKTRAALLKDKYKMDVKFMKALDDKYGPLEWRLPEAHAIYWASMGIEQAKKNEKRVDTELLIQVRREIYESMMFSLRHGRLIRMSDSNNNREVDLGPNLALIPNVNKAFEDQMAEDEKNADHMGIPHRNFLMDAVFLLYVHNRKADAARWYQHLAQKYPDKPLLDNKPDSLPRNVSLDDFAFERLQAEVDDRNFDKTKAIIEGLEEQALYALAIGDDDQYIGMDAMARQIYERFLQKIAGDAGKRLSIPTVEETRQDILKRMLNGGLDPEDAARLANKKGLTNAPPDKPKGQ